MQEVIRVVLAHRLFVIPALDGAPVYLRSSRVVAIPKPTPGMPSTKGTVDCSVCGASFCIETDTYEEFVTRCQQTKSAVLQALLFALFILLVIAVGNNDTLAVGLILGGLLLGVSLSHISCTWYRLVGANDNDARYGHRLQRIG